MQIADVILQNEHSRISTTPLKNIHLEEFPAVS
jgi:hypothetical protein